MFGKPAEIISRRIKNIESIELSSQYTDKKVYSKSGEFVGKVYDIAMKNKCFIGLMVSGKRKVFIDKDFFESDADGVIMLKIEPVVNLLGKQVFDSLGKIVGKVVGLNRKSNKNDYEEIVVKKSFFRRAFNVPKKDVEVAKENIILKKAY
jgi:sporulation protein YlmC with PRC-barrel domain